MELVQVYFLLFVLHTVVSLLPVVLAIVNKDRLDKPLRVFYYYCLCNLFLLLLTQSVIFFYEPFFEPILDIIGVENTSFLDIFYFLRNFMLLGFFFYLLLKPSRLAYVVKYLGITLTILCSINYLFIEGYKTSSGFNSTVDAIFCFIVPLIYCKKLFNYDDFLPLFKNPYFWITIGQVFVALIGFFLFFSESYLQKNDPNLFFKLAVGRNILMIIEQIMYAIAFYYARNTRFLTPT